MGVSHTTEELLTGIVGSQCVAPIWINGTASKALWVTGLQVEIISKVSSSKRSSEVAGKG